MSLETKKRIRLIWGILLSVLIVAAGVCLAVSCVIIYRSGERPFTRESIGTQFSYIALPVYLCLGGILGGVILAVALPLEPQRIKGAVAPQKTIERLMSRVDTAACAPDLLAKIKKEQTLRRVLCISASVFSVALAVPSLIYLTNLSNFDISTLNRDIVAAMKLVLPSVVVGLGAWVAVTLLQSASYTRELSLVKEALKVSSAGQKNLPVEKKSMSAKALWAIRCVVLAVALLFVMLGIFNGGMTDVLEKAIKICTECIGLG